jgi:outer membrane lipoprotein-sorting protein
MMRLAACLIAAGLGLAAGAGWNPVGAQQTPDRLSEQDREDVQRFQDHLDTIETLRSDFVQIASNGSRVEGTLWIKRPGRMRVEYAPPIEDLLVATGIYLIRYDAEMQQSTYLPLDSTPASVLLDEELDLTEHVEVLQVQRTERLIHIQVRDRDSPEAGSLFLSFSKDPIRLAEWTVVDAQGQATNVQLVQPQFNLELPGDLFYYIEPTPGWDPDNPNAGLE